MTLFDGTLLEADLAQRVQFRPATQGPAPYLFSLEPLLASGAQFGTIYADPPWPYKNQGTRGSTHHHFASMTIEAICALPIAALAAPQAHCHLWITNAFLFDAPRIFAAWGFTFASSFAWVKPGIGTGNYWRLNHELMLLGVRGGLTAQDKGLDSWIEAPRTRHSAKPERVRDRIEALSPGPYLELFGRAAVPGWTVWGNERRPADGRLFQEAWHGGTRRHEQGEDDAYD